MLKADVNTVSRMMQRAAGFAGGAPNIHAIFPFQPQDVEGIYTQKAGEGLGIWFRLHDGRVYDSRGKPADTNPAHYGETE